jgi:hypothetical protein
LCVFVSFLVENPIVVVFLSIREDEDLRIGYMASQKLSSKLKLTQINPTLQELTHVVERAIFDLYSCDYDKDACVIASSLDVSSTELRDLLVRGVKRFE